jgi:Tol biopolymer transport system component/DNA-binding winged helix-turn-helix (wHTH) protein
MAGVGSESPEHAPKKRGRIAMTHERPPAVVFGPYRFEPGNGLWRDGQEVALPPRALGILDTLIAQPGEVVSKQRLIDAVWKDAFVTDASLLEAIRVLRDALADDRHKPTYIQTVHRRGYRFIAPVARAAPVHRPSAPEHRTAPDAPGAPVAPDAPGSSWLPLAASLAAVVAMIAIAMVFALFGQRPSEGRPTTRFTIALPDNASIDPLRGSIAVSADGTRMVYVALSSGRPRLFLRTIDRDAPQVIDGSDGASDPFLSPDGEWVGFFAHGSLKKLRIDGGTPVVICAARAGSGAAWSADGTIVFGGGPGGGLARVSADGGEPVVLTAPAPGSREIAFGWPDILPDGTAILYTAVGLTGSRIALHETATGVSRSILDAGAFARYSPTGHLVFERRGRLEAATFSLRDRRVTAASRPILRGLATSSTTLAGPRFAFSTTGSLLYVPGTSTDVDEQLHWLDIRGGLEPVALPPARLDGVDVAPDLRQLAMTVETDAGTDLWIGDLRRGAVSRVLADGRSTSPTWRPDGLEIAFAYAKAGPFNLFLRPADTEAAPTALFESPWNQLPTSWSPDGRLLAFTEFHPMTGADVWVVDVTTRERRPLVRTLFDESHARISPDGRWMAYMSNEAGRWDVFIRPVTGGGPRVQVSTEGGAWPCWSVDGRTLYFSSNGRTAAVSVSSEPSLRVSAPAIIPGRDDLQLTSGHAASDRVLVRQGGLLPARRELRVVLGWFSELMRLAV